MLKFRDDLCVLKGRYINTNQSYVTSEKSEYLRLRRTPQITLVLNHYTQNLLEC